MVSRDDNYHNCLQSKRLDLPSLGTVGGHKDFTTHLHNRRRYKGSIKRLWIFWWASFCFHKFDFLLILLLKALAVRRVDKYYLNNNTTQKDAQYSEVYLTILNLNNYFDFHVCLSIRPCVRKKLHSLQSYSKIQLIKVVAMCSKWKICILGHPHTPARSLLPKRSRGMYTQF